MSRIESTIALVIAVIGALSLGGLFARVQLRARVRSTAHPTPDAERGQDHGKVAERTAERRIATAEQVQARAVAFSLVMAAAIVPLGLLNAPFWGAMVAVGLAGLGMLAYLAAWFVK